ncbi:hypothetical protein [Salinactinospora qingdaonensis]
MKQEPAENREEVPIHQGWNSPGFVRGEEVKMGEFLSELRVRIRETHNSLQAAEAAGDEFLADAHASELEDLHRIAVRNGVDISNVT